MNRNAWRYALDPRDPDYDEPPEQDDDDFEEPEDTCYADDDPRGDGPYHYQPPGEQ